MAKTPTRTIISRIDQRLKALAPPGKKMLSDRAGSLKSGLSPDGIRTLRRQIKSGRQKGIRTETLDKLAYGLETTPEWLLREEGPETIGGDEHIESGVLALSHGPGPKKTVRIVGYVGANGGGEVVYYRYADDQFDYVEPPPGHNNRTVAAEIRGGSLGEAFKNWLVFYRDIRSPVTEDLYNRLCVVGLSDDRILVKIIKREGDGSYTLVANDSGEKPIENAQIEWAAKVTDMRPR